MQTLLYGASTTESTVSMPLSAGRQCRKMACGPACFIIASLTWKSRNTCMAAGHAQIPDPSHVSSERDDRAENSFCAI